MSIKKQAVNPQDDLGFGTQAVSQRVINRDGSINVNRRGLPLFSTIDNYNTLITMSWKKFWLIVIGSYLSTNLIFACFYLILGVENLNGADGNSPVTHFFDAFFFSAQTISTVGYGHISPKGFATNLVAALESMMGLLVFALATGLLYGRFSRPSAKMAYSDVMLVAPYLNDSRGLMVRVANRRRNMLVDLSAEIIFSYNEMVNGKPVRRFYNLNLERRQVSIMTLSWTLVHPLDESSPLYQMTHEDLANGQANFAVLIKAFDDTFSQTVHSRTSYQYNEVVWDAKFAPAFYTEPDGRVTLDLTKISNHQMIQLP
ncbi:ion transporter [Mucilaginibacter robiniae]|uniref:Ion transporter n=1 Tax=Mucilaginibacter robiniae TaxID=2728022 RepID=A0A7L5E4U2_9SPHI|nr:ion channel [Mucilaginibacter robiniae]QJD97628.1 ion transporter [Mucilaginibacter robiniae]